MFVYRDSELLIQSPGLPESDQFQWQIGCSGPSRLCLTPLGGQFVLDSVPPRAALMAGLLTMPWWRRKFIFSHLSLPPHKPDTGPLCMSDLPLILISSSVTQAVFHAASLTEGS